MFVVSANEARIWVNREIRKGNWFFCLFVIFSYVCEWMYSLFVFLYFGVGLSEIGIDFMAFAAVTAEFEMASRIVEFIVGVGCVFLGLCSGLFSVFVLFMYLLY